MNTILWVNPSSNYLDEAEEFLSQQHDNMVKQMYKVKKEQTIGGYNYLSLKKNINTCDVCYFFSHSHTISY